MNPYHYQLLQQQQQQPQSQPPQQANQQPSQHASSQHHSTTTATASTHLYPGGYAPSVSTYLSSGTYAGASTASSTQASNAHYIPPFSSPISPSLSQQSTPTTPILAAPAPHARLPTTAGAIWNPMNPTPSSAAPLNATAPTHTQPSPVANPSSIPGTPSAVESSPHPATHQAPASCGSPRVDSSPPSPDDSVAQVQRHHLQQQQQRQRQQLQKQRQQQQQKQQQMQQQQHKPQQYPQQQQQKTPTQQQSSQFQQSQPAQQQQQQQHPALNAIPQTFDQPGSTAQQLQQVSIASAVTGVGGIVGGAPGAGHVDTNVCYASLLGMAETFRTMSPPNMRLCLHCLKAILTFKLPVNLEARTHLQIGKILFQHSRNDDQIKFYLEKARALAANLRPPDDVIKFEADDLLADFFERLGERYDSINVLNYSVSISTNNPYWQCRALLKLAQANVAERDIHTACDILAMGAEFAQIHNSDYTRGLFLLSKCMLLLTNRQLSVVNNTMTVAKHLIDNLNGGTPYQKEALRIFYLIVTVSHTLIVGQNKSARPNLRLLHQAIQQFAAMDEDMMRTREVDQFQWLPREQMVVLVYLITAMHSMQWGSIDKALKYTDKALTQIEKLSLIDSSPILTIFQLSTLEHIVMCRLVSGNKTNAVQVIGHLCRLCMAHPRLMHRRGPQLHTLLGLYAMSMNCMDNADAQFHMALKLSAQQTSGDPTTDPVTIFIVLNLALVCLRQGKTSECHDLLAAIKADSLPVDSHYSLRASAYFVKGLAALFAGKYHEARGLLRETLKMANQEDLHRLIACSLVVLGQTFMNMGNLTEAQNMLKPAIRVANCIPDISVQLWSASLLKDMYSLLANRSEEENWKNMHGHYSQSVITDHIDASSQQEHQLINWLEGPLPDVGSGGSGSGGSGHPPSSASSAGHALMGGEDDSEPGPSGVASSSARV